MIISLISIDTLPTSTNLEIDERSQFGAPVWGSPDKTISVLKLRERFRATDVRNEFIQQTPRFTQRFPIPKEKAIEYIGNDACPEMHQFDLADRHFLPLIEAERQAGTLFYPTSEDDRSLGYFVCSFHDLGEPEHLSLIEAGLTPVGDLPAGTKTEQNRIDEKRVLEFIFRTNFGDIDPAFLERAIAIITHKPLPGDEFLHDLFQAAHDFQTLETTRIAAATAERQVMCHMGHKAILRDLARTASQTVVPYLEGSQLRYITLCRLLESGLSP